MSSASGPGTVRSRSRTFWAIANLLGHESLLNAKIPHRDKSLGNIMLTRPKDDGFLIDLNPAVKIYRENASGAPSKTGTTVYVAMGALYSDDHNFMHDLESFFWVLFWICVHWNGLGLSKSKTEYESWNYEPTRKLVEIKTGRALENDEFDKEIGRNFTAHCRALAPCIQEIHKVVFPVGKRWVESIDNYVPR
ncbi:hypothetical protein K469DRAFT_767736 [Zopfia rhizophila CBS 207.26]|uniref:Fungal-type protein kinase domain-containing protein n=1 Tax=Zopfia rhizophila CBS 207.26 TaxID=1314779 RepID=A0A6A6EDG4_9PEZI|nr:hypothetical protein K469DRAFT_767736 [Zopfia rhizophila CBS 207.26]